MHKRKYFFPENLKKLFKFSCMDYSIFNCFPVKVPVFLHFFIKIFFYPVIHFESFVRFCNPHKFQHFIIGKTIKNFLFQLCKCYLRKTYIKCNHLLRIFCKHGKYIVSRRQYPKAYIIFLYIKTFEQNLRIFPALGIPYQRKINPVFFYFTFHL